MCVTGAEATARQYAGSAIPVMDFEDTADFLNLEVLGVTLAKPGETGPVKMPGLPDAEDLRLQDYLEDTCVAVQQEDEPDFTLMGIAVPPLKRPTSGTSGSTRAGEGSEDNLSFRSEADDYFNSEAPTSSQLLRMASAPNFERPDSELGSRPNTAMSQAGRDAWASLVQKPRGAVVVGDAWRPAGLVGSNSSAAVPSSTWCKVSSQARMDSIRESISTELGSSYLARAVQLASSVSGGSSRPTTSLSGEKLACSLGSLGSLRTSGATVRTAKHLPSKMHSQRWWPKSMLELRDETLRALDPQSVPEFMAAPTTPSTRSRPPSRVGSSGSLRSAGKRKVNWPAGLPTIAFAPVPHGGFPQDVGSRVGAP